MLGVILTILIMAGVGSSQDMLFLRNEVDNSIRSDGELCELSDGSLGICTEIKNCEFIKKKFDAKQTNGIVHCAFRGKTPLVCCPQSTKFVSAICKNTKPSIGIIFKITNGDKAALGEFPYQAALGRKDLNGEIKFTCGGSIIADDIVLTAAHCVNSQYAAASMVRLGRTTLNLADLDDDSTPDDIDIEVSLFSL
jgi:hypothetical protein